MSSKPHIIPVLFLTAIRRNNKDHFNGLTVKFLMSEMQMIIKIRKSVAGGETDRYYIRQRTGEDFMVETYKLGHGGQIEVEM